MMVRVNYELLPKKGKDGGCGSVYGDETVMDFHGSTTLDFLKEEVLVKLKILAEKRECYLYSLGSMDVLGV